MHRNSTSDPSWPVFVLTLAGDEARAANLIGALKNLGVNYQLFFGVDGRNGLTSTDERLIDRAAARRKYRRDLSDAEFACALSHQRIYQEILAKDLPGAIILEDDAVLEKERFQRFVAQRAFDRADLILLDHSHARVGGQSTRLVEDVEVFKLSLPCCLTTGYSISSDGARYLIDAGTPLSDVADWPGDITEIDAVVCAPRIVTHPDQETGASHLRSQRTRASSDPLRFFQRSYWKRWLTKRKSMKIS